jgi:hypothetical protein
MKFYSSVENVKARLKDITTKEPATELYTEVHESVYVAVSRFFKCVLLSNRITRSDLRIFGKKTLYTLCQFNSYAS